ncbi:MAG: YraN family protein [Candidatus Omnitrophica bacterium]|nr:YraN family protein [Candidatus Omnitrophota bacterium]
MEVKTRISEKFGPPLASITKTKKEHIIKNCLYYLKRHGQCSANYRIDAVGIKLTAQGELQFLRHVRGAIHL